MVVVAAAAAVVVVVVVALCERWLFNAMSTDSVLRCLCRHHKNVRP